MINLIFKILIAHFIGDVALQDKDLVELKQTSLFFLTAHSFIYGGVVYFVFGENLLLGLIATISHFIIDKFKIMKLLTLVQDQILHFTLLFIGGILL